MKCFSSNFSAQNIKSKNKSIWGRSSPHDLNGCQYQLLRYQCEAADDIIFFHISHAVCFDNFPKILLITDAVIFISTL